MSHRSFHPVQPRHEVPYDALLGHSVGSLRRSQRRTQRYMARALGVTRSWYGRMERGETEWTVSRLASAADVLNVELDKLIVRANSVGEAIAPYAVVVPWQRLSWSPSAPLDANDVQSLLERSQMPVARTSS